ncbi:MAG TPA: hypothetical protein PLO53_04850 [Candidatus Hydrogenedentes bacterium]|nr:hypothetical protein [Candidatus Hydrogenedentota bacterium]HPU97270.1 hypothetical protein [Candidatus Hydrogenedentota bacterium]
MMCAQPDACAFEKAAREALFALREDMRELRDRLNRIENAATRGAMLLLANLAAIAFSLAEKLLR